LVIRCIMQNYYLVFVLQHRCYGSRATPIWVDVSEEISANLQQARMKMEECVKAHAKALVPSFGDGRDDHQAIEVLTHAITCLLKRSKKRLQKLSMQRYY
jgi:syntaxin 16